MTTPFEEGRPESLLCLLGEAPGKYEMMHSRPFVGPAGRLLDEMLHHSGIARRACYITNIWDFQVKKDGELIHADNVLLYGRKGLTDAGRELAQPCLERLNNSGANCIVPMGNSAFNLLCPDKTAITKWRGSVLEGLDRRKVLPTIHPAAILRGQYLWKYAVVSDLHRAKEQCEYSDIRYPRRNLITNPLWDEVREYLHFARGFERVAFDIECLNRQVSCFSLTNTPWSSMCIPMIDEVGKNRWTEEQEAEIWQLMGRILGNEDTTKVNQNILFDISFLYQQNSIITRGYLADSMVAHSLLYPDLPMGLDYITSIFTEEPYYKDDRKLWSKPWADPIVFWEYNAKDSAVALECWDALEPELDAQNQRATYDRTMNLVGPLTYTMTRGIKVDRERLEETRVNVERRLREKEDELKEAAEWDFNPNSPKQCQEYFYVTKGIKPYTNRKTHRPTTDDKAMSSIVRRYNLPEARLVQNIRGLRKLLTTYLEVGIDDDGRLRCSYNIRGARTGRLSSSQTVFGTGLNMQNLHPEFKDFLVADA